MTAKTLFIALFLASTTASAGPVQEAFAAYGVPKHHVAGTLLIKLHESKDAVTDQAVSAQLRDIGERTDLELTLRRRGAFGYNLVIVRDPADTTSVPTEDETLAHKHRVAADKAVSSVLTNAWYQTQALPNDEYIGDMWHLSMIGAPDAWDITTGDSSQRIGVIDTGLLRSHPDLAAKDAGGYDFIDDVSMANDGDGWDADYEDVGDACPQQGTPDSWHGSHVSGTIAAATNNNTGIAGVNWHAKIVTGRSLGACGGDAFGTINAVAWMGGIEVPDVPALPAAERPTVINMSLGGIGACEPALNDLYQAVKDNGTLVVVAAGNDGGAVNVPANCPAALAVGAFNSAGALANYSSFGSEIDIVAPGGQQDVDWNNGVLSVVNGGYEYFHGTSMAAPHVAGVASLLFAVDPNLSINQLTAALTSSGYTCTNCDNKPALVASASLQALADGGVTPPPPGNDAPAPSGPTGDIEPNDWFAEASDINCGQTITGELSHEQDFDHFMPPTTSGSLAVTLSPQGQDLDLYITTGDDWQNGDVINWSENTGDAAEFVDMTMTGPVAIVVVPYETSGAASYTLTVECDAPVAPAPNPPSNDNDDEDDNADEDDRDDDSDRDDDDDSDSDRDDRDDSGSRDPGSSGGCSHMDSVPSAVPFFGLALALGLAPRRRRR